MMRVETKPLSDLSPADYNPRAISEAALAGLAASIQRWGIVEPIVWNERTGNVVGGHQRLKVLAARGDADAPVVVVDLPDSEERALNLALNSPHIAGDFTVGVNDVLDSLDLGELPESLALESLRMLVVDTTPPDEFSEASSETDRACPMCGYEF